MILLRFSQNLSFQPRILFHRVLLAFRLSSALFHPALITYISLPGNSDTLFGIFRITKRTAIRRSPSLPREHGSCIRIGPQIGAIQAANSDPSPIQNIHIRGEGLCILEGADFPRATGDDSKLLHAPCPHLPEDICKIADWVPEERQSPEKLDFWDIHNHSYGTDAGKEGESQYGDWRCIGIPLANVQNFSIENVRIVKPHGWGISLEACAYGRISKIDFDACMYKEINGMRMNTENQDGIDIRNGCHNIIISDITGQTGDNMIALTAIASNGFIPGGSLRNTHVIHNDWSRRDRDIHDIIISNVMAHSYLCYVIRLRPGNARIWNVSISNVIDNAPSPLNHAGTLLLGELDGTYDVF